MKKRYKNKKSMLIMLNIVLIIISFSLTIGFSSIGQNLFLNISAFVRAEADIRVTGISVYDSSSSSISNWEEYDVKNAMAGFTLPNADSTITYKIEITNVGSVEMGIFEITGLPDNLEYEISEYTMQDKLCDESRVENKCNLGIKKEILIKVKYKNYDASNINQNINLKFDFRSFHNVVYTGFEDTSSYPSEVIDGGTLKVPNIPSGDIEVYLDGVILDNSQYSFVNQNLELDNVVEDVEIKFIPKTGTSTFIEFMKNQSLGTDAEIDFADPNILPGVYMNEETKNLTYPVYYYRGAVTDNNVIYANYCWKMVRTTEYGGMKLVYNGSVSSGKCEDTHDYLGSESFNKTITDDAGKSVTTPSQVGFKYGETKAIELIAPSYENDTEQVIKPGIVIGHDVKYENGMYTLVNSTVVNDLNELEDEIRGGTYSIGYHYTCLTSEDSCATVYYIYFDDYGGKGDTSADGLYGMALDNGLDVKETLDVLLSSSSNKTDSYVKGYLDTFFEGSGSDFTRSKGEALINHLDELDDVKWCNDRSIAGYHGWDLSLDNHSPHNKYLHFSAYGRLVGDEEAFTTRSRPDLFCDSINDSFTVSSSNGNGSLKHPIGLLTADEAVLAGALSDQYVSCYLKMISSKHQFFMTPYYISDDHVRLFTLDKEGLLASGYPENEYAIRPAIALKSTLKFNGGSGTTTDPYKITK